MSFGGKTSKKCLYAIMRHLFVDDVLLNYSWGGTVLKSPFNKLNINDVMKKCV